MNTLLNRAMNSALLLMTLVCVAASTAAYAQPLRPQLALNFVTHDETGVGYVRMYEDDFDRACNALIAFAAVCQDKGAVWHLGVSESLISAVERYTSSSAISYPKDIHNVFQHLQVTYGVVIDVHAHNVPTYGALACRLYALGVTPSQIMSGFLYEDADWTEWNTRTATCGSVVWEPRVLWGGATPFHADDPEEYGIWKPNSETDYYSHNASNRLWLYAHGPRLVIDPTSGYTPAGVVAELDRRVSQMDDEGVPLAYIYPSSILMQEHRLWTSSGMIVELGRMIDEINTRRRINWIRIDEVVDRYERAHGGHGFLLNGDMSGFTLLPPL